MTETIEFHVRRSRNGYMLHDEHDNQLIDVEFTTETEAANAAMRFAQDQQALYRIFYI